MKEMVESINNIFDGFKIKAKCVGAETHRHFAFYDLKLDPGTRISRIQRYADELAIAMRAKSSLIVKPVPSKGIVRLQTTFREADTLFFEKLYNRPIPPKDMMLPFVLGETDEGDPLWVDMSKNPHLLVAGSTGSGKSILLHTLIANASKRKDMALFLIDTKHVEFTAYSKLDHLVYRISNDYYDAMNVLERLSEMMENRYLHMSERGIKSLEESPSMFYKVMLIIDEVADLMLWDRTKDFERLVAKLAQKARAAGIYMVFATQRPSVDVVTGTIKANFPARLSCKVTSKTDSKVILDRHGAENLAGRGDAILNSDQHSMTRFQVAYSNPGLVIKNS